jgi:hypothetical protein
MEAGICSVKTILVAAAGIALGAIGMYVGAWAWLIKKTHGRRS